MQFLYEIGIGIAIQKISYIYGRSRQKNDLKYNKGLIIIICWVTINDHFWRGIRN